MKIRPIAILARFSYLLALAGIYFGLCAVTAYGSVTARISGTVKDPSGAVVPNVQLTAVETQTGIKTETKTDADGFYSFPSLAIGQYQIKVEATGFRSYLRTGLILNINTALTVDVALQIGEVSQQVTVNSAAEQIDTVSTQMGATITSKDMTSVPLNGRSYTDLLALQPGVAPTSSNQFGHQYVSGDLNPGIQSVDGQREQANGFTVNGGNVEEGVNMGTAVIPNLDSIAEFRIITNNFDAEYGNYSGGQINLITKSGTNELHGDVFEFNRNTEFNTRNYFALTRPQYTQNQFGGTVGGPIRHDKLFYFTDYQGTRSITPPHISLIAVPSTQDRQGNLADLAGKLVNNVNGANWARELSQKLGYTVSDGEPYFTPGCSSSSACVFPNAVIPQSAFSPISQNLMKYIPAANQGANYSQPVLDNTLRDDKGSGRVDYNSRLGMISGYYFLDDYTQTLSYLSSTVPGFAATNVGRAQQFNLGDTKTLSATMVNELRLNITRNVAKGATPSGGTGVTLSSLGFVTGAGTSGIDVLDPQFEGVPQINLNEFSFGVPTVFQQMSNTTYQAIDNLSKVAGAHTMKFGFDFHEDWVTNHPTWFNNGEFSFNGGETGSDWADFLLGAPHVFLQGQQFPYHSRAHYLGLYGQDSWRIRPGLTMNYGLRYDVTAPWSEAKGQFETLVPGLQSQSFPGAPTGWVFPGDPGIPDSLAPVKYNKFAPRMGLAWSPSGKLFGAPGTTSIRAAFGIFYTAFMDVAGFQEVGDAPYGNFYFGPHTEFATPYIDRPTGANNGQKFPVVIPPVVNASHPDNSIDWSQFEPISTSPGFWYKNTVPYSEEYSFSIERQLQEGTILSIAFVGNESHHLLSALESNPGDPALCLSLSQPNEVAPGSPTCGPDGETQVFTLPNGQVVNGTRAPFGINFGSNAYFITAGNSNYNSLQVNLEHRAGPLYLMASYTWSKAIDDGSGWADQLNVVNQRLGRALSVYDTPQDFVFHYQYELPFATLFHPGRLASGWVLSGITSFVSGVPVTLTESDDNSLLGTDGSAANGAIDVPNFSGHLRFNRNPRSGLPYFDPSAFSAEALGQLGNSSRRFFHGPGSNNWDIALLKNLKIHESQALQFRLEGFNAFNHTQFEAPDGEILDSNFGMVTSAQGSRILQAAVKFDF